MITASINTTKRITTSCLPSDELHPPNPHRQILGPPHGLCLRPAIARFSWDWYQSQTYESPSSRQLVEASLSLGQTEALTSSIRSDLSFYQFSRDLVEVGDVTSGGFCTNSSRRFSFCRSQLLSVKIKCFRWQQN